MERDVAPYELGNSGSDMHHGQLDRDEAAFFPLDAAKREKRCLPAAQITSYY